MKDKRHSPLDRALGQLDHLDETNLQILINRLAQERELFEGIFNAVREGIMVVSQYGVIEYANNVGVKMVGFNESDIGSAILWKWIPDLAPVINMDGQEPELESVSVTREIEMNYPEHRFVRVYMAPFDAFDGDGPQFIVILSDITREVASTEEKIESEKASSIFLLAAGVAHELGNPLNSLTIHLQLMQRLLDQVEDKEIREKFARSLSICAGEVERQDGIITHFLEAIRPSPPDFQDMDLIEVLESVLQVQGQELSNSKVTVEMEVGDEAPIIAGDMNQMKQLFFNVIKNAHEAMQEGGTLHIETRSDDDHFYVIIADTGAGIEAEDLSHVFQPYYSTKSSGSGLGLMIVNRILRDHGGQVGIDSKPSIGTVISLKFPKKHKRVRLLPQT
ncbi:MAG: PAS domain-containing sensor histidine kinase [Opitutaceae bacterium]|nr:PAS domain-containing sensor histidine kinase [Opitutaceae bacterium]|tara:strand:- start:3999 stop:5174 length:1176 start_codon:yes stop_codon:yes gene_type:complete